jgi:hypothetical protein
VHQIPVLNSQFMILVPLSIEEIYIHLLVRCHCPPPNVTYFWAMLQELPLLSLPHLRGSFLTVRGLQPHAQPPRWRPPCRQGARNAVSNYRETEGSLTGCGRARSRHWGKPRETPITMVEVEASGMQTTATITVQSGTWTPMSRRQMPSPSSGRTCGAAVECCHGRRRAAHCAVWADQEGRCALFVATAVRSCNLAYCYTALRTTSCSSSPPKIIHGALLRSCAAASWRRIRSRMRTDSGRICNGAASKDAELPRASRPRHASSTLREAFPPAARNGPLRPTEKRSKGSPLSRPRCASLVPGM